ncbi:hypothetical protein N7507_011270 [Penicillium longicatenatum]|nr:hypothetical protein N7507_011270 [Penicillium longicatenatum]
MPLTRTNEPQQDHPTTESNVAQTPKRRQLAPHERVKIVELKAIGWSYKEIQKRYSHIPMGTIKTTIARASARGPTQETLPRPGGPKKLSDEDRKMLLTAISEDPGIKNDHLLKRLDHNISRQTLWKFLREQKKTENGSFLND